jgi:adenylate cyclase
MSKRLQVLVYENRQLLESSEFDGPVELGRQRDRDEVLFSCKREPAAWRWVIARRDETTVGRNQILVTPLEEGRARVSNGSERQPIRFLDRPDLQPSSSCELTLPVVIILGPTRTLRVQRATPAGQVNSLADVTLPPRTTAAASRLASLVLPASGQVSTREMVGWLHSAMDVLQAAADSADFFDRAARGVVDAVSLDSARVLLWQEGAWRTKAVQTTAQVDSTTLRGPSLSVLEKVRRHARTFWEEPGLEGSAAESLAGVETVVAAPILSKGGEVIGALYGERRRPMRPGALGMNELEASLVELLARGVAAGLARLEEERKAMQHRVQFEQFFTPELVRPLLNNPRMLEPQDREVTLMFCDIRGFSRVSERLGAAQTIPWCRDVLDTLSEAVFKEGGTVVDYIGDGLMAMFGAPEDQPDHAERACRAALVVLEGLPALNARWLGVLGEPMAVGVGINTGVAQVGNVGSNRKFKYGALGPPVNLASRVEGLTKYFKTQVLLTASTQARLDDSFLTRRLGLVRVVGIKEPVEIHELLGGECPFGVQAKAEYEQALLQFEGGEFGHAARTLGNWRGQCPSDDAVLVLLLRAVRAMVEGKPASHPVLVMTEK